MSCQPELRVEHSLENRKRITVAAKEMGDEKACKPDHRCDHVADSHVVDEFERQTEQNGRPADEDGRRIPGW